VPFPISPGINFQFERQSSCLPDGRADHNGGGKRRGVYRQKSKETKKICESNCKRLSQLMKRLNHLAQGRFNYTTHAALRRAVCGETRVHPDGLLSIQSTVFTTEFFCETQRAQEMPMVAFAVVLKNTRLPHFCRVKINNKPGYGFESRVPLGNLGITSLPFGNRKPSQLIMSALPKSLSPTD
jgi:hypothetical protein